MRRCRPSTTRSTLPSAAAGALSGALSVLLALPALALTLTSSSAGAAAPPPPPPRGPEASDDDAPTANDEVSASADDAPETGKAPPPPPPASPSSDDADADAASEGPEAAALKVDVSASADAAPAEPAPEKKVDRKVGPQDPNTPPGYAQGFHFGSYGRVVAGGDATGRPMRNADIVAFGSRLDESTYAELEVRREDYWEATDSYTRMVMTLAMANPVFHYTGNFDATMAIRNLYIEAADIGVKGLRVWMGSRMYRGDDIYVLNFWPLDNLNTVGGGLGYYFGRGTAIKLHAGLNQPHSGWFKQTIDRPLLNNQLGAAEVALLDRQKVISSLKVEHVVPVGQSGGVKGTAYGELHYTGAGQREVRDQIYEDLPADKGFVAGGQVSAFTGKRSTYATLVARYARGLAAYGEFNAPVQLALDRTSKGAHELLISLAGNYEAGPFGVMLGSYYRIFRNASPALDYHDLNEGIALVRPQLWLGKRRFAGIAIEGSYQAQQRGSTAIADDGTTTPLFAQVGRFGIIPFLTPGGQGAFTRPHFQLIYLLTARDAAARSLYAVDDVYARRGIDHFIGMTAEWWFGSTSYFRD